jgi:hypothetical protein
MRTAGESDPHNPRGPAVVLFIAGGCGAEPPKGNRIALIVLDGSSCWQEEAEGKIPRAPLNVFSSGAKVTLAQQSSPCTRADHDTRPMPLHLLYWLCLPPESHCRGWPGD